MLPARSLEQHRTHLCHSARQRGHSTGFALRTPEALRAGIVARQLQPFFAAELRRWPAFPRSFFRVGAGDSRHLARPGQARSDPVHGLQRPFMRSREFRDRGGRACSCVMTYRAGGLKERHQSAGQTLELRQEVRDVCFAEHAGSPAGTLSTRG